MELRENSVEILTQQLVRRYTDELEDKQLEGYDLCSTEGASVLEKDQQAGSQELDFWLKQLNLEKHRSSVYLLHIAMTVMAWLRCCLMSPPLRSTLIEQIDLEDYDL